MAHFLDEPENSVTRERIFLAKFEFDIRLAAARAGVPISLGIADVDRHGYDVILQNHDDDEHDRKVQLKTRSEDSETGEWKVFKRFFRPRMREATWLRIPFTPETIGLAGSIIVMDIIDPDEGEVRYRYTDYLIVRAFDLGIIERVISSGRGRPKDPAQTKAQAVLRKLEQNVETDQAENSKYDHKRVAIPEELFVTAKSPDHLLGLLGIRNTIDDSFQWPNLFLQHSMSLPISTKGEIQTIERNEHIAAVGSSVYALLNFTIDPDLTTRLRKTPSA